METQETQGKPRVSYADFVATQKSNDYNEHSVGWVLQVFIDSMNGWNGQRAIKPGGLGESHLYTLLRLRHAPIAKKHSFHLTEDDIIEHCEWRIKTVCAATINQDVNYLHGALKYVKAARRDCREIKAHVIPDVRPFLLKNGYVGKSTPRKRVPTDDEIHALLAEAAKVPLRDNKTRIKALPDMIACGLVSSRRLGEICGLRRSRCDWEHKDANGNAAPMYTVEKMKHPTKKDHTKTFPIPEELAAILKRQPVCVGKEDYFFPFRKKSVSAKYTRLKKKLGIVNLRFHDNRRAAITYWLQFMTPHQVRHFVSGHESVKMIEDNYDATDPALGHSLFREIAAKRETAAV